MIPKFLVEIIESDLVHEWKSGVVIMSVISTKKLKASLNYLWDDDTEVSILSIDKYLEKVANNFMYPYTYICIIIIMFTLYIIKL